MENYLCNFAQLYNDIQDAAGDISHKNLRERVEQTIGSLGQEMFIIYYLMCHMISHDDPHQPINQNVCNIDKYWLQNMKSASSLLCSKPVFAQMLNNPDRDRWIRTLSTIQLGHSSKTK